MCRLLAIYGLVNNWKEVLIKFQQLSETGNVPDSPDIQPGHLDGWGMAVSKVDEVGMELVGKYLGNALTAEEYGENISSFDTQPHVFLCHLRKASPIIPISLPNCHPFITTTWSFIHNGTVFEAYRLSEFTQFPLASDGSDSEYLFHYFLERIIKESVLEHRIQKLINSIKEIQVKYSAINCIMSNGIELYAIRNALKLEDYYSLFYYQNDTGIIVCSEKLPLNGVRENKWKEIPNLSLLAVSGSLPSIRLVEF